MITNIYFQIIVFLMLFFLILHFIRANKRRKIKNRIIDIDQIQYGNHAQEIIDNLTKSKNLYTLLIKRIHPDKQCQEMKGISEQITSRLNQNKTNFRELKK
jgi:hypothetical protein